MDKPKVGMRCWIVDNYDVVEVKIDSIQDQPKRIKIHALGAPTVFHFLPKYLLYETKQEAVLFACSSIEVELILNGNKITSICEANKELVKKLSALRLYLEAEQ